MPVKQLLKDKDPDRKFRLLFEDHPQPMWVFDAESQRFLEANRPAADLYGYSIEEFRSMTRAQLGNIIRAAGMIADVAGFIACDYAREGVQDVLIAARTDGHFACQRWASTS